MVAVSNFTKEMTLRKGAIHLPRKGRLARKYGGDLPALLWAVGNSNNKLTAGT